MIRILRIIFPIIFLTLLFSCKSDEDVKPVDDENIYGTWKLISTGSISGNDTVYVNFNDEIFQYFSNSGDFKETKVASGSQYSSTANYEFSLVKDTLSFYTMGSFSHYYIIDISGSTMYVDISETELHKLKKQI
jgi:hypothetical protein